MRVVLGLLGKARVSPMGVLWMKGSCSVSSKLVGAWGKNKVGGCCMVSTSAGCTACREFWESSGERGCGVVEVGGRSDNLPAEVLVCGGSSNIVSSCHSCFEWHVVSLDGLRIVYQEQGFPGEILYRRTMYQRCQTCVQNQRIY